jgi:hypothetical protein
MSTATEVEIRAAVERWARVRGFVLYQDPVRHGLAWGYAADHVPVIWQWGEPRSCSWDPAPAIALAWAILVESEPPPVDVGPCPECKPWWSNGGSRRGYTTRESAQRFAADVRGGVYESRSRRDGRYSVVWNACPACSGTGRKLSPVPRLLLDATTDATARAELLVYSDRLQNAGDPRGDLLMWALALWTGEPIDCGPCRLCVQREKQNDHARSIGGEMEWPTECPACSGSGRQFGHLNTGEAVRWLEWLTWARELG